MLTCQERNGSIIEIALLFEELNRYVNMHEKDSGISMKFVINIFKTDIEQTNSMQMYSRWQLVNFSFAEEPR